MSVKHDSHAWVIARAIALNSASALNEALVRAPKDWPLAQNNGFSCWARVLISARRTPLITVLQKHGWHPPAQVWFRGRPRPPLALALQYGNLAAVNMLLDHGATADFQVEGNSVLLWALDRLSRPFRTDSRASLLWPGRALSWWGSNFDALAPTTQRLLAAGAKPCPKTLGAWINVAVARPKEPWLDWCEQAWQQGLRPAQPGPDGKLTHPALPIIRAYMDFDRPFLDQWLDEALSNTRQDAMWIGGVNKTRSSSEFTQRRLLDLIQRLKQAWPQPLDASCWHQTARGLWFSHWRSQMMDLKVLSLGWALDNNMPLEMLVMGDRPLLARWWSSHGATGLKEVTQDLCMAIFTRQPQLLDTPLPKGVTLGQAWKQLPSWDKMWPQVEATARQARALWLDERLPKSAPSNQSKVRL